MNEAVWIVGGAVVVIGGMVWQYVRAQTLLDHWAERNGLKLLEIRRPWMEMNPFSYGVRRPDPVFRITASHPTFGMRRGWVRCGGWFTNLVEVIWDPEDRQ